MRCVKRLTDPGLIVWHVGAKPEDKHLKPPPIRPFQRVA
jgi:hypothetical protein